MIDLHQLAARYKAVRPNASTFQIRDFLVKACAAVTTPRRAMATDSVPFSLKKDNRMNGNLDPRGGRSPTAIDQRRRSARDQDPMSAPGAFTQNFGGGDQDDPENGGPTELSCDDIIGLIKICMSRLSGSERDELVGKLHGLLSVEGISNSNGGEDRAMRSGPRRVSRDRKPAHDRRPALDSNVAALNAKNFAARWPEAAKIRLSANGRY
jgi:hypothetical protein